VTDELETVGKVRPGICQVLSRSLLRGTGNELGKHQNKRRPCRNLKQALIEQESVASAFKKVGRQ
jgi:hypothetical protein